MRKKVIFFLLWRYFHAKFFMKSAENGPLLYTCKKQNWDQALKGFEWALKIFHTVWLKRRQLFLSAFFCLTALNTTCNNIDEFECGNGDCVNYTLTCDGMAHCKDKSDEKQSYCGEWNFNHLKNSCSHFLVVDISNLSPHFLSGSQLTVCAKRATGGVWMVAVWGIVPGATGGMTVETILMKSSVTVGWVLWLNKFFLPAEKFKQWSY